MRFCCLIAAVASCFLADSSRARAGDPVPAAAPAPISAPAARSPIETFRKLLAMPPADRDQFLTNYPPENRERILGKIDEYLMLPPDLREMRLRLTELRWYLVPLLKASPAERSEKLKAIPDPYKELIAARLDEWDIWPPDLKDEVLEYESAFYYFVGRDIGGTDAVRPQLVVEDVPEKDRPALEQKLARWRALPAADRERIYDRFRHYFELSEKEQEDILKTLPDTERRETEKVVMPVERWPKPEKEAYLTAVQQFSDMSPAERQSFMRNAEQWRKMSPAERQAMRDLVTQLARAPRLPRGLAPLAVPAGPSRIPETITNSAGARPK